VPELVRWLTMPPGQRQDSELFFSLQTASLPGNMRFS
jgi:hypothetical protein